MKLSQQITVSKRTGIALAALVAVLLALLVVSYRSSRTQPPATDLPVVESAQASINITSAGFSPATLSIKKGTSVTWTNQDSQAHRVASSPHPAHTGLPGLDSKVIGPGESYSFTFDQPGRFGYHDHLSPSLIGVVEVGE